jgi:hypothetical protein
MKFKMLVIPVIGFSLAWTVWADGYKALASKGYRWVTINGPYACPTEQELRQVTSDPTEANKLHMVHDGGPYYLIPGNSSPE